MSVDQPGEGVGGAPTLPAKIAAIACRPWPHASPWWPGVGGGSDGSGRRGNFARSG